METDSKVIREYEGGTIMAIVMIGIGVMLILMGVKNWNK